VPEGGLRFSDIIHEGTIRWHQLGEGIPDDVATVIVQHGDPLDSLIRENPALAQDVTKFEQRFSSGRITVYSR
jgi:hypothetical protein